MSAIEISNVSKSYALNRKASVTALQGIDLSVAQGEFVALIGPSGCGKSTLLHLVAALETLSSGSILIDGEPPAALRDQHRLGIAFQDHALLPWLSIEGNLALPYKIGGVSVDKARIKHLIELVGLVGFEHARPSQLSGGMRQRAAIARSLCLDPALLLLDEPFGALDPITRERVQASFVRIRKKLGLTSIFVTHDMAEALLLGDRIAVMRGGRLLQIGTGRELARTPADPYVAELVGAPLRQARALEALLGEAP